MPTVLTHAALPLIAGWGLGRGRIPWALCVTGAMLAVLPDLDLLGRLADIDHRAPLGHRGISHALVFAAGMAMLASVVGNWRVHRWRALLFLFASGASHGLTDMLTTGGKGIMLWWPFDSSRFKFLFHPVEVSPVLLDAFRSGALARVLVSELLWLLLPALLTAAVMRRALAEHIDSPQGRT